MLMTTVFLYCQTNSESHMTEDLIQYWFSSNVLYVQTSTTTNVDIATVEKLSRRCRELEHQLAAERSQKEDQLSEVQQRQIDDIVVKYKERIKSIEDEKMAVMLSVYLHYSFK